MDHLAMPRPRLSWLVILLVPYLVVTRMSTVPLACAGVLTVILVAELTVKVAAAVPNFTEVTSLKLVPVIVTVLPAEVGAAGR